MENIFEKIQKQINKALKEGEKSYVEFIQSEIHKCDSNKDGRVIFYVTPKNILKFNTNIQSVFGSAKGTKVKCCMWCGFEPKKEKNGN